MANGRIEMVPEALAIVEYSKVWKRDKTVSKEKALIDFSFLYFMTAIDSVYRNFPEPDREKRIIDDLGEFGWKPDKTVYAALEKHMDLHRSLGRKILEDAEFAVDKVRKYFREVNLAEKDKNGKLLYSAKDLVMNIRSIGELVRSLNILRKEVDKEEISGSKIRGGGIAGPMEEPESVVDSMLDDENDN